MAHSAASIMGFLPPVVARLFADIRQYEANMAKADDTMLKLGTTTKTTSETMAAGMNKIANKVLVAGAVIGVVSVKMAADFQSATTRLVTDAGESVKNIDMIRKGILGMAGAVGATPKQLADGMYYIESAGYHGADALKVLKASAQGAAVGFTDMASMSSAVTTVLRDYNLGANRSAAVTSALIETVALGKTNMTLLANSMGRVLPIAASFGIPFKQVAGAIATMTVSGQQARFGVQQIRNSFSNLAAPGNQASKIMAEIGISGQQLHQVLMDPKNGVANALTLITEQLAKHFPRGSAEFISAERKIYGGITGLSVALALGGTHTKMYIDSVNKIGQAYESNSKNVLNFADVATTLNFKLKQLGGASSALMINVGNWLLPKATDIANWANGIIIYFQKHPVLSKAGAELAGGLFATAIGIKISGIAIRMAGLFGAEISTAWAGPWGLIIGAAIITAIKEKTTQQISTVLHPDKGTPWWKNVTNAIGVAYNYMRNFAVPYGVGNKLPSYSPYAPGFGFSGTTGITSGGFLLPSGVNPANLPLTGSASQVTRTVVKTKLGVRVYVTH